MGLFDALRSPPRRTASEEEASSGVELGEDLSNSSSTSELLSNHEVSAVHNAFPTSFIGTLGLLDWLHGCLPLLGMAALMPRIYLLWLINSTSHVHVSACVLWAGACSSWDGPVRC